MTRLMQNFLTFMMLLFIHHLYQLNLDHNQQLYFKYYQAVQTLHDTMANSRDLSQHHFQECNGCGYALALQRDSQYCLKSDVYKLLHPKITMDYPVVFRDYAGIDLARQLIKTEMYDALPSFSQNGRVNISRLRQLPLTTSVIYPYAKNYFRTHRLGSQAGCLFQKYAHIPGQDEISLKTNQTYHSQVYLDQLRSEGKPKKCIDDAEYLKKTFMMWREHDCQAFFNMIDSDEYQKKLLNQGIQYIFKTNRHLGNGIMVLDYDSEAIIRQWYQNGYGCGRNMSGSLIQEYVTNPYLFKGHKMEFRAYFQIASTNPPTLYGYKSALIKQCALPFNLLDATKQGHVCNTAITQSHNKGRGISILHIQDGDDDHYIDWKLEELQDLLLAEGKITSKNWLNDFLRPQMYRKVIHLYLSVKDYLFEDSRVSEFFGVDFIMDTDFRLWVFECNRNPNFLAVTQGRQELFGRLITDMINLSQLQVNSKYQRVKKFIEDKMFHNNDTLFSVELQAEFMDIQQDYLEKEFELPSDSHLELVYVDSPKRERYQYKDYISKECQIGK